MKTPPTIQEYCTVHTQPSSQAALLETLRKETEANTECPKMISAPPLGRLLKLLAQLINAKRILEIGTFTGYSALCMAEALPQDGQLITLDNDPTDTEIAKKYFEKSEYSPRINFKLGNATETIKSLSPSFDLVFVDADKPGYPAYYEAVLPLTKPNGLILFDNALKQGRVLDPKGPGAQAVDALNKIILKDTRVENSLLPLYDGINIVRKR